MSPGRGAEHHGMGTCSQLQLYFMLFSHQPCRPRLVPMSAAAAAALPSASSLPAGRTATENKRGPSSGRRPLRGQSVHRQCPAPLRQGPCAKSSQPRLQGAHRLAGTLETRLGQCVEEAGITGVQGHRLHVPEPSGDL